MGGMFKPSRCSLPLPTPSGGDTGTVVCDRAVIHGGKEEDPGQLPGRFPVSRHEGRPVALIPGKLGESQRHVTASPPERFR